MRYENYSIEDFIEDEYFQKWVLDSDSMTDRFWEGWLKDHPDKKSAIEKAKRLILLMSEEKDILSEQDFESMWRNIVERRTDSNKIIKHRPSQNYGKYLKAAAIVIVILLSYLVFYQSGLFVNKSEPPLTENSKVILQFEDGSTQILDESSSGLLRDKSGKEVVKKEQNVLRYDEKGKNSSAPKQNVLTVPYGKKFGLVLSDGTQVFLNSGTKLSYPTSFSEDKPRNVYLDGEAYFSVQKDENRPFTVITEQLNTQVYGTEFNVSYYQNELKPTVVLVEGKVGVYRPAQEGKKSEVMISPGEIAYLEKNAIKVSETNVDKHIAWIEGKLLFVDDNFSMIVNELERHFNVEIENTVANLEDKKFTASFEKESLEQILKVFQAYTPFSYKQDGRKITISTEKNYSDK